MLAAQYQAKIQHSHNSAATAICNSSQIPLDCVLVGLLSQSEDCVKVLGVHGTLDFMNCNGMTAMEIDDFGSVSGNIWWELWPNEQQRLVRDAFNRAVAGTEVEFDAACPTAKGTPKFWRVKLCPMISSDSTVVSVLCTSRELATTSTKNAGAN